MKIDKSIFMVFTIPEKLMFFKNLYYYEYKNFLISGNELIIYDADGGCTGEPERFVFNEKEKDRLEGEL